LGVAFGADWMGVTFPLEGDFDGEGFSSIFFRFVGDSLISGSFSSSEL
jgi:hypothetical protein